MLFMGDLPKRERANGRQEAGVKRLALWVVCNIPCGRFAPWLFGYAISAVAGSEEGGLR